MMKSNFKILFNLERNFNSKLITKDYTTLKNNKTTNKIFIIVSISLVSVFTYLFINKSQFELTQIIFINIYYSLYSHKVLKLKKTLNNKQIINIITKEINEISTENHISNHISMAFFLKILKNNLFLIDEISINDILKYYLTSIVTDIISIREFMMLLELLVEVKHPIFKKIDPDKELLEEYNKIIEIIQSKYLNELLIILANDNVKGYHSLGLFENYIFSNQNQVFHKEKTLFKIENINSYAKLI